MNQGIGKTPPLSHQGNFVSFPRTMRAEDELDLRPLIADGQDPLAGVMAAARELAEGAALVLVTPFDPRPLRRVLAGKGFSSSAERVAEGHWRVKVIRDGKGALSGDAPPPEETCSGDADTPVWEAGGALHIDVRGLAPPLPMVAILRLIHSLDEPLEIIVHHDREPHYLVPELAEIGWSMERIAGAAGEVRLRLRP